MSASDAAKLWKEHIGMRILDVRKSAEYNAGHLASAENMPLEYLNDHLSDLDKGQTYYVHCAGGYRSMIFISILRNYGYYNLINIAGGYDAIKKLQDPLIETATA